MLEGVDVAPIDELPALNRIDTPCRRDIDVANVSADDACSLPHKWLLTSYRFVDTFYFEQYVEE